MDIKESLELLEGVKLVGVAVAKIAKDGKLDLSDAAAVVELVKEADKLIEAVKGAEESLKELKDIDQVELLALGTAAYGVVKAILDAKKA